MTNPIALTLALLILGALAIDAIFYDSAYILFLLRKFYWFLDWLAFWRGNSHD